MLSEKSARLSLYCRITAERSSFFASSFAFFVGFTAAEEAVEAIQLQPPTRPPLPDGSYSDPIASFRLLWRFPRIHRFVRDLRFILLLVEFSTFSVNLLFGNTYQANSLRLYLTCIRNTLDAAMCLQVSRIASTRCD